MAKYLLSYDEQDVKNGKLDVSPDGVLKSAGKGGSDDPVLPQKVMLVELRENSEYYWCGQKASELTPEEALALCLKKIPFVMGGEDWFVTAVHLVPYVNGPMSAGGTVSAAGVRVYHNSCCGTGAAEYEITSAGLGFTYFKQS